MASSKLLTALLSVITIFTFIEAADRSFVIDYENDTFLKDGEPIQIVSGSMHYFRIHPTDWTDRLYKLRYAGFNTLQIYVEWATHEVKPGEYDFSGFLNLTEFIRLAQEQDLLVILRPGPFIDSERDMGGLPAWLLKNNPDIRLRTMDPAYLDPTSKWMRELLSRVQPQLYSEGGPIIMVQVENEYGSAEYCDYEYTNYLRDLFREELGDDVILHTTDIGNTSFLRCGHIPDTYATVDFGTTVDINQYFEAQREFEPHGPLMNSEFYPGWIDHWGHPHSTVTTEAVTKMLDQILAMNASVNMYPTHGGTSFGLRSGANFDDMIFQCQPTNYDFDCPIDDIGDLTSKYYAVRDVIGKYLELPDMEAPTNTSKAAYGDADLQCTGVLFDLIESLPSVENKITQSFEDLDLSNGVVVYESVLDRPISDPAELYFPALGDRAFIYVDGKLVGKAAREQRIFSVPVYAQVGQKFSIVVESQGRIDYGAYIDDRKGLSKGVMLGGAPFENWNQTAVDLEHMSELLPHLSLLSNTVSEVDMEKGELSFYSGTFSVSDEPKDTFLRLDGWNKGVAYINDFCIGRYWPVVGPQITLYVPHGLLNKGENTVALFEMEGAPCTSDMSLCKVTFTDKHVIDGPTPYHNQSSLFYY